MHDHLGATNLFWLGGGLAGDGTQARVESLVRGFGTLHCLTQQQPA